MQNFIIILQFYITTATHVFDGTMTAGQLAGFCMYAGHLADGVSEISESVGGFLRAQGSGARLFSLLDRGVAGTGKTSSHGSHDATALITSHGQPLLTKLPQSYKPTVRFEEVGFSYPSHPHVPILQEVSFTLSNGEMLALTGSSG